MRPRLSGGRASGSMERTRRSWCEVQSGRCHRGRPYHRTGDGARRRRARRAMLGKAPPSVIHRSCSSPSKRTYSPSSWSVEIAVPEWDRDEPVGLHIAPPCRPTGFLSKWSRRIRLSTPLFMPSVRIYLGILPTRSTVKCKPIDENEWRDPA
jgi:hypothetical protein